MNDRKSWLDISHYTIFAKHQTAATLATGLDFLVYIILVEWFSVWYVVSAALGALSGAVCSFLLNRHWCFQASNGLVARQLRRFILVTLVGLLLNSAGVYLFTDIFGFHYVLSKVFVAAIVAVLYNYPLQRYFVFAS